MREVTMSTYTIGTLMVQPEIRENLFNELNFLSREGIKLKFSEKPAGKFHFFNCDFEVENGSNATSESMFRHYLANVITDLIMNPVTKTCMHRILKHKYQDFDEKDAQTIIENAYVHLQALKEFDVDAANRHHMVFKEVSQYLLHNSHLYLEGFLRFRLKAYFREMTTAVEKAVENFIMEKEYREFIQLLRYFVEIQEPKIDEVHVLVQSKQEVYFLDEINQPVKPDQITGILHELEPEVEYEDWLLSALITIAPRKIVLHLSANSEMVQTILSVFEPRVFICDGCSMCQEGSLVNPKTEPH